MNRETENLFTFNSRRNLIPWLLMAFVILLMTVQLFYQGRVWWCQGGDLAPWSSAVWSQHNSQHLFDPYTFTHILHGVLFYWISTLIFPKMPPVWRLLIAVAAESAWEILENTNAVIERYREATVSLDYFGDSVANSLGDVFACAVGFVVAQKLKFRLSLAFFILTEIILLFWIRDSLLLNILMLIYPLEAVKQWQMNL
jgi:hypothetical protein